MFYNEPVIELPLTPHHIILRLQSFDFEGYAHRVADAVPRIKFILLEISNWQPLSWQVLREDEDGAHELKTLGEREGGQVISGMKIV